VKWVRTYPESLEVALKTGRAMVVDPQHCEPFYLTGYDYLPLLEAAADDLAVLEWDIALSREDRATFTAHCQAAPGLVHVASYRHYDFKDPAAGWGWVHRLDGERSIGEGAPAAQLFGLGCAYLPLWIMRAFLAERTRPRQELVARRGPVLGALLADGNINDVTFSWWHWAATGHTVPVHWDVRPIHLNYPG
jgi:hypothetical protein